jgi:hypothetical protein
VGADCGLWQLGISIISQQDLHLSSSGTFHNSRIVMDGFEGKRWITTLAYPNIKEKHSSNGPTAAVIYIYIYIFFSIF